MYYSVIQQGICTNIDDFGIEEMKSFYLKDLFNNINSQEILRLISFNFFYLFQYLPLPKMDTVKCIVSGFSLLDFNVHRNFTVLNKIRGSLEMTSLLLEDIHIKDYIFVFAETKEKAFTVVNNIRKLYESLVEAVSVKSRITIWPACDIKVKTLEFVSSAKH